MQDQYAAIEDERKGLMDSDFTMIYWHQYKYFLIDHFVL